MDQSFKKIIIIVIIVFALAGGMATIYPHLDFLNKDTVEKQIVFHQSSDNQLPFLIENKGIVFKVNIKDTEEQREKGLSETLLLAEDEGMLFVFDDLGYYQMWMKGMLFPIDIIWLDQTFKVVDIKKNLTIDTYPESFGPRAKAKYVLEINAGLSDRHGFGIGDKWKVTDTGDF